MITQSVAIPIQDGREMEKNQNGMGIAKEGDPAYTIDTTNAQSIAIQGTIIGRSENAGPGGVGATEGGPMFTLTKTDIHAVAIPFRKSKRACSATDNETLVLADAANTLNNFDLGDTRTTHAVVGAVYENHAQDSRVSGPLDVAPTVAAKFGTGGGNVPLVSQDQQIYENSRRDALRIYEGTSPTLQSFMGTGGCNVPMVQPAMAVRRLTSRECERLQGFPDDWSRIPWKGKPEEDCPDGPRYKACGNSMAVPCMFWIGNRIAQYEAKA